MSEKYLPNGGEFLITKEYRRFAEFCDDCRSERYIGLCYGYAGVGKTLSARHYADWDQIEALTTFPVFQQTVPGTLAKSRTVFYTPSVDNRPNLIEREVTLLRNQFNVIVEEAKHACADDKPGASPWQPQNYVELVIVDEADWIKVSSLEQLRSLYDRSEMGLILIGMPGIEKRLARYPQLYSRVGFVHQFRPLSPSEIRSVLTEIWGRTCKPFWKTNPADEEAISAIIRISGGNFRLIDRLVRQIERLADINELSSVTRQVVETARESLVIGVD